MSSAPSPADRFSSDQASRTSALAGLALAVLLSSLGTSIPNVALPRLVDAFDTSLGSVQWVVLSYLLAVTTVVVSVGRLGDLIGRRRLMIIGIGFFTAASMACAAASELWILIAARAAQGIGAAVMMALAMALVGDAVPKHRAGHAMGLLGTMSAVGTALGPSLGGGLLSIWDWPAIFAINVPLGVLALVLAVRFLPTDATGRARPAFDVAGSVVLIMTLAAYALATTQGRGTLAAGLAMLCVAGVSAVLFIAIELQARSPLVPPQLFLNRIVATGFATSALTTTIAMTTLVVGPFYLSGALGLRPAAVGAVMTAGPLVAALVGVPAGRGVDRFGARPVTLAALSAMLAGSLGLAWLPVSFGIVGYVLPLVILTAGFAAFQAANNVAVVTGVDDGQRGVVSGLLSLSRNLGLITGASAMGAVFAAAVGRPSIANAGADAIAMGMHTAFAVSAVLAGVALLLAANPLHPTYSHSP